MCDLSKNSEAHFNSLTQIKAEYDLYFAAEFVRIVENSQYYSENSTELLLSRMRHAIKKSSRSQTKLFDTSLASEKTSTCQSGTVLNQTGNALAN